MICVCMSVYVCVCTDVRTDWFVCLCLLHEIMNWEAFTKHAVKETSRKVNSACLKRNNFRWPRLTLTLTLTSVPTSQNNMFNDSWEVRLAKKKNEIRVSKAHKAHSQRKILGIRHLGHDMTWRTRSYLQTQKPQKLEIFNGRWEKIEKQLYKKSGF